MQNKIDIGTTIDLQDLLQSRLLIQANSGGGKSVLARVLIEKTFGIVPFIVMDIEGEYYTLKENFGDLLIIGGQHADIPINLKSVKLLPKEIIANRLSVVIDLSDLQMNDRILYAKYFLETMMDLPKDYWINYLVFIEEAHKLCGEQDKQASATAVKDLMSRGRKRGYCGVLLTQRISKLHKDAAAECNNKFIGRTFLDIDLDRSAKELGLTSASDKNAIRNLMPGNFYAFGTSIEPHQVHEVKIKLPQTKIPKAGVNLDIKPKAPTEKIKAMLVKLNEIETEKPKTVMKLLKTDTSVQENEINSLKMEINSTHYKLDIANKCIKAKDMQIEHLMTVIEDVKKALSKPVPNFDLKIQIKPEVNFPKRREDVVNKNDDKLYGNSEQAKKTVQANGIVTGGALRMLKAAAMFHPNSISKARMGALAGMSYTSGTFGTYERQLRRDGLIVADGKFVTATKEGIKKVGDVEPLPTDPQSLITMWSNNVGPDSGMAKMLRVLFQNYPQQLTAEELGNKIGMSHTSGTFGTYERKLRKLALITKQGGFFKAADELFN